MKRLTLFALAALGLWALAALPSSPAFSRTVYEGRRLYAKSWALVVGINRYASSRIPRLEYAEADVRDMKAALVRLGFPEGNVRLVLGRKATRREILRVLEEDLDPKMAEDDRLFIYFSGHGVTTRVHKKQAGFLLAYDSVIYDWPRPGRPTARPLAPPLLSAFLPVRPRPSLGVTHRERVTMVRRPRAYPWSICGCTAEGE